MRTTHNVFSSLWFCFLLAIYSSCSCSASAVLNGGFEDGALNPWYQGTGTIDFPHDEFWNITSARSFSGTYSVTNVGNNELRQDFKPVAASQITELSFYLLMESFPVESAIQLYYDDGTFNQAPVPVVDVNVWQHVNVTDALDINKQLTGIGFFGIRSSDPGGIRLYLDDINVIATPLPSSLFLFISALIPFYLRMSTGNQKAGKQH